MSIYQFNDWLMGKTPIYGQNRLFLQGNIITTHSPMSLSENYTVISTFGIVTCSYKLSVASDMTCIKSTFSYRPQTNSLSRLFVISHSAYKLLQISSCNYFLSSLWLLKCVFEEKPLFVCYNRFPIAACYMLTHFAPPRHFMYICNRCTLKQE